MLYLALILLVIAVIFFWISGRQRKNAGLPGGRVIYTDTRAWGKLEQPLFDASLGLTGKPDYLVEQNGRIIPVEVKSGRAPQAPYDSHIFQLASYCHLVEKKYGKRPHRHKAPGQPVRRQDHRGPPPRSRLHVPEDAAESAGLAGLLDLSPKGSGAS